jgi:hypothetical protein
VAVPCRSPYRISSTRHVFGLSSLPVRANICATEANVKEVE